MQTLTIAVSNEFSEQLTPYKEMLEELLQLGLRDLKMRQSLTLFKRGNLSIWKAARLAKVSLREMIHYAALQGVYPQMDSETLREELA